MDGPFPMALAYKPTVQQKSSKDNLQRIPNFPFSHVVTNAGLGVVTDNFNIDKNVIITGLSVALIANGLGQSACTIFLNGVQLCAHTVVGTATIPKDTFIMVNIPDWNTGGASLLRTVTNCTAGVGQANITWIGYYI